MSTLSRRYATVSSGKLRDGPLLTLEHFVQRGRTLQLWRNVVRATNKIEDGSTRNEMRAMARAEFERNRLVHDLSHIRYLISTGKTQLDSMARYVEQNRR